MCVLLKQTKPSNIVGFTLVETLIALAIIAVALTAAILTLQTTSRHQHELETKTMGHWVAGNILAQARLKLIQLPAYPDYQQGQMKMFSQVWYWQGSVQVIAGLKQWVVTVAEHPRQPFIVQRSSYVSAY